MSATTTYPFTTSTNYTYDSSVVEITGGVAKLKDITPTDATCAALYTSAIDLTWGDGVLTGTGTGSPTITSGKLDLTGASNQYVDYDADLNADSQQTGCMRIDVYPNYTGNPANDQYFMGTFAAHNNGTNSMQVYQTTNTRMYILCKSSSGAMIFQSNLGNYAFTAGTRYTLELNWDLDTGASRLFINGSQHGSTIASTGTRSSTINLLRVGQHVSGTSGQSDFSVDNFAYFSTVQHTSNHTGSIPFDVPAKYSVDNPTVVTNFSFKSTGLTDFSSTETTTALDSITYIINASGQGRYVTGGSAADSDGTYSQSSSQSDMDSDIANIISTRKTITATVFLNSEGGTTPELDLLSITYNLALPVPSPTTLCELEGFIYDNDSAMSSEVVYVRPFAGFINDTVLHKYEWQALATTDSDGYFVGNIYVQTEGQYWELKVGKQNYKIQLPNSSEASLAQLAFFEVIDV